MKKSIFLIKLCILIRSVSVTVPSIDNLCHMDLCNEKMGRAASNGDFIVSKYAVISQEYNTADLSHVSIFPKWHSDFLKKKIYKMYVTL